MSSRAPDPISGSALRRPQRGHARSGMVGGGGHEVELGLARAAGHAGASVFYQDGDLRIVWACNVPSGWADRAVVGADDSDFLPPFEAAKLVELKRRVLGTGVSEACEIRVDAEGGPLWFDVWIDPDDEKPAAGLVTTMVETTEHKAREQILKSLLREVSHRSKNLLAIIQSIATQTGRYSGTIESFLGRFRGRLQSLAASQDLVTLSNWRGADLRELIGNQVGRYASDPRNSVRFEGANPYLNPNAALHIGLALHELAVNSISYGALAQPSGFVSIRASHRQPGDGDSELELVWREAIEAGRDEAVEKRFGSVALERVVPASLRGEATLTIGPRELEYRLVVPAESVRSAD